MGQRLNIEIYSEDKLLANAYYHWSGYTSSSLKIASKIIDVIEKGDFEKGNDLLTAISLLELTGAKFNFDEVEYINKYLNIGLFEFDESCHRNDGLIAVSPNGCAVARDWEEARIQINFKNKSVRLPKICYILDEYHIKEMELNVDDLPELTFRRYDWITFERFKRLFNEITNLIQRKQYRFKDVYGNVYSFIE